MPTTSAINPNQLLTPPASAPKQAATTAPQVSTNDVAYRIGPQDVLDISVFQGPPIEGRCRNHQPASCGEIAVAGQTIQQVERNLTARLGAQYLQNPQVTVAVKEYNSQSVTISGAVGKPGVYSIRGRFTLMQAVAQAGDLKDISDSTVLILREKNGQRLAAKFDVSAIQKGEAEDPILEGGDQIVAGTSTVKKGFNLILKSLPIAGAFSIL